MNADSAQLDLDQVTGAVIGAAPRVHRTPGCLIVKPEAQPRLDDAVPAQTLNDLRASSKSLALVLNFGNPHLEIERVVDRH